MYQASYWRLTITCAGTMRTLPYIFLLCNISKNIVPSHLFEWKSMAVYSRRDTFVLGNLTVALFDREEVSSIRCGHMCFEKSCCKGYMYSKANRRCVGLQFDGFGYTADINLTFSSIKGMIPYLKGSKTGWVEFKGHYYYKGESKLPWSEAKMKCRKLCSYLVEIESKEESDWISKTFLEKENCAPALFSACSAWTGLNDLDIEGRYIWDHSNASLTFTNWHPKEPSLPYPELAQSRDCIDILRGSGWNDRPCTHLNWVICEKQF